MKLEIIGVISLRASALALSLAGQTRASQSVNLAADAVQSGVAVDEHMQTIADKLKAGPSTDADWDDVDAGIKAASARVQGA